MIKLRPYQQEIVNDPAQFKAIRGARRIGKTTILVSEILKRMNTEAQIGVFTNSKAIAHLLRMELEQALEPALVYKNSLGLVVNKVQVDFYTNPTLGLGKIYDLVIVDEAGYMDDTVLNELYVMAEMNGSDFVIAGSPPERPNSAFQNLAEMDVFKQWHVSSDVLWWSNEEERAEWKKIYTEEGYKAEILAEWPEEKDNSIERKKRREVLMGVDAEKLLLLLGFGYKDLEHLQLTRMWVDQIRNSLQVVVSSDMFDEVPPGVEPPGIGVVTLLDKQSPAEAFHKMYEKVSDDDPQPE